MPIQKASNVGPAHIEIAYETFGAPEAPPVLLIMGLGSQMLVWPEGLIAELVGHNLRPIRFDNRDAGLSTHFSDAPLPDFQAAMSGDTSSAVYNLSDMAADTVGLLDALSLPSAHLVGASMGGFIAQTVAIEYPDRVRSLTSMMSTTGAPNVGQPAPETARLFAGGTPRTREEVMDRAVLGAEIIGSPGYPFDVEEIRARTGLAYDRAYDPAGVVRQSVACLASGDRTAKLRTLNVPTLVIHGANDRMADVSGGLATADAIPGAQLVIFEGMGHSLPRELWPKFASLIAELVQRAEADAPKPSL